MLTDLHAVVFDLDGTLYASTPLGREINLAASRYIAELKGMDLVGAAALVRATKRMLSAVSGIDTPLSLACIELGGDLKELHRRFAAEIEPESHLTRDERVVELLRVLGDSFELFIYTNNNRPLTDRIMGAIGVRGLFDRIFTIEDFWRPKPDRQSLETVFNEIGRRPSECLFVGDRYDIDLRLPAAMGSAVFLAKGAEELLNLIKFTSEE